MMKFGLYLGVNGKQFLVDMATNEILTETMEGIDHWLKAYEGNYSLILL